jgi:quinoprotein glucose dehydrogenase
MPGEKYSPTQPFPTKPPPYDQQGVTIDDLIDFTPELRAEAIKIISQYRYGPLFTPPSLLDDRPGGTKGTIHMPGTVSNVWNGAAFDPETGILYVPSAHCPVVVQMVGRKGSNTLSEYINRPAPTPAGGTFLEGPIVGPWLVGPQGLPIFKPPYGRLVAIDLNKGEILWTAGPARSRRASADQDACVPRRRRKWWRHPCVAPVGRWKEISRIRQEDRRCRV